MQGHDQTAIIDVLKALGAQPDAQIESGEALLAFARQERPEVVPARYRHALDKLIETVKARHRQLIKAGAQDDNATRLAALYDSLIIREGFVPCAEADGDLSVQLNIFAAIDTHKAHPALLVALFIACAQACGWAAQMLNLPKHFILRLSGAGAPILCDPAQACQLLQAHDIRERLKQTHGENAELKAAFFEPRSQRDMILTLQNIIKLHRIAGEDYTGALQTVQAMQAFAPQEYRLQLDAGVLYARSGQPQAAIFALDHYIAKTPDARARAEAQQLRNDLLDSQ